nr:P4 [Setosphaeria turcica polymycovirus 2]
MSGHYLSESEATALSGLSVGVLEGVLKLSAHGLKAESIHAYATAIAGGKEPEPLPVAGGPRPVTIQLHSFLRDPRQYGDTYHISHDVVNHLRSLELSDREAAREGLLSAVSATSRIIQSGRPVRVVFEGSPGDTPTTASPLANATSINKSLAAEIASNSVRYGSYRYDAVETPLDITQRFAVDLGQNFFVLAFSKKAAIAVARIASVKGRGDPAVLPFIVYINSAGQMLHGKDIPESYWNCVRGPRDALHKSDRKPGATVARGNGGSPPKSTVGNA